MDRRLIIAALAVGLPVVVIGRVIGGGGAFAPQPQEGLAGAAGAAGVAGVAGVAGAAGVAGVAGAGSIGPDVITGSVPSVSRWGTDPIETSYSFATTSCNIGDVQLDWFAAPSDRHPVIGQNMYRLSADGRFEQVGQAWVKHAICALQLPLTGCGDCDVELTCENRLKPGCADPYTAVRNGIQLGLGPKWQVNGHTGQLLLNATSPYWNQGEGTEGDMRRRVRVSNSDLDPELNAGARYFIEGQYIAKDDASAGNQNNNASYREVTVDAEYGIRFVAATEREKAGILAWRDADPTVTIVEVQVPGEGLFILGYAVTRDGDSWRYEYALYNMNSDRSASAFNVPIGEGVDVTSTGFHDVDYHSGDGIGGVNFDGTDWPSVAAPGDVVWSTVPFEINASANALRWGTLYNFRLTADAPPAPAIATIHLFKPGTPESVEAAILAPRAASCAGDVDADGEVGFADLLLLLVGWGPCPACPADLDGDGDVDFEDLLVLLVNWGPCY